MRIQMFPPFFEGKRIREDGFLNDTDQQAMQYYNNNGNVNHNNNEKFVMMTKKQIILKIIKTRHSIGWFVCFFVCLFVSLIVLVVFSLLPSSWSLFLLSLFLFHRMLKHVFSKLLVYIHEKRRQLDNGQRHLPKSRRRFGLH